MAPSECSTDSLIPSWVTIGVGSLMLLCLIATSVHSYTLLRQQVGWNDRSFGSKMKCWAKDIWGRKSCYLPLISHLADTTTDFAAVAEFYILARDTTKGQCGELNIWYIFGLSVSCMAVYRIVSGYIVYTLTKSWIRVCTQLVDLELFRVLYVSHKYKLSKKSSPQRLIGMLEVVFEAAPQTLLQFIFLMKTHALNPIILLSVIMSLLNLTSSTISDDKTLDGFTVYRGRPLHWKEQLETLPWLYLFRILDIPSHILCLCFLWQFINGNALTIVIAIDCVMVIIIYWKTNKCTDALMGLVVLPLSFGDNRRMLNRFWLYRILWIISMNITLWIYFTRDAYKSPFVIALWWFASLGSIIKFVVLWRMYKVVNDGDWSKTPKERGDMAAMYRKGLFSDVLELMFYIHTSPKSAELIMDTDNKPRATLLCAVYQAAAVYGGADDWALVNKMVAEHGIDMYDSDHKCCGIALHAVCGGGGRGVSMDQRVAVTKTLLQKATMRYLKALDHDGKSLFMRCGDDDIVLMDLIWERCNELWEKEDQEEQKEEDHLIRMSINDKRIQYLNTVVPQGYDGAGWNAVQYAIYRGREECFRKFLSWYPTSDSKRDIIFKTDLPYHSSFLICGATITRNSIGCCDILWEAIEEMCNGDENRDEIITNYLNVQRKDGDTALMESAMSYEAKTNNLLFKVLSYYPSLVCKQDALKMKNNEGKDALQILKDRRYLKEADKEEAMRVIEGILNGERQDIGTTDRNDAIETEYDVEINVKGNPDDHSS
eukprot:536347_1